MTRLAGLKAGDLVKFLMRLGFRKKRQKGSHLFMEHPDGRTTVVPMHSREDIGRGLFRQILREIELSPEEFRKFLGKP